jgi:HK97 family phage major capsid protein
VDKDLEDLSKEMKESAAALRKQQTELQEATRICLDAMQKGVKLDKDTQANIDKAIADANTTGGEVRELAKKLDDIQKTLKEAAAAPKGPVTIRSAVEKAATEHGQETMVRLSKRDMRSLRLVLKDVNSAAVAGLRPNPYLDTLVSMERQPLRIRDLMTVVPITTDSVRYGQQTVRTNNAATVAEGTSKPYSTYAWENRTATVEVIAHLAKLTLQALADIPRLAAEIESEMRFGLDLEYERQILNGDGTGELDGLIENATAYGNPPAGASTANILTPVDALRIAILKLHLAYMAPDGHVLNPIDIANIELLRRDPDKGGGYLFGNPDSGDPVLRLWRVPTVETPSIGVGAFLTGAFKYSTALYEREGVEVLISTENDVDFEKNQATMRCERRSGMAVKRPQGLIYGSFSDIT